jgi:hypothetical protein
VGALTTGPEAVTEGVQVAHAAALRALLTQPPDVLPNQVGDPLLPRRRQPTARPEKAEASS